MNPGDGIEGMGDERRSVIESQPSSFRIRIRVPDGDDDARCDETVDTRNGAGKFWGDGDLA